MLIPHSYSVIAIVDHIHRRVPYPGGRLALADVFETVPGFLLVPTTSLPSGTPAAMARESGCVRIAFDATLPRPAQRLAIAHEIGHALLHAGHVHEPICDKNSRAAEDQADFFAQELLAPLWAVREFMAGQESRDSRPPSPQTADFFEIPGWLAEKREDACRRFYVG